jgi:hypothetical protein
MSTLRNVFPDTAPELMGAGRVALGGRVAELGVLRAGRRGARARHAAEVRGGRAGARVRGDRRV